MVKLQLGTGPSAWSLNRGGLLLEVIANAW